MSPHRRLQQRASEGKPVRVRLIGAPGVQLAGIADLSPGAVRINLERVGWQCERLQAASPRDRAESERHACR